MTLQQSLAGDLFWGVVNAIVLVWVAVGVRALIRRVRARRRAPTDHCQIGDCTWPAVATYDKHPSGTIRICASHDQRIQRIAPTTQAVYNQDLNPGSDMALWDREMQS